MELHLVGSPSADGISALSAVAKGLGPLHPSYLCCTGPWPIRFGYDGNGCCK